MSQHLDAPSVASTGSSTSPVPSADLAGLRFANRFTVDLPADPDPTNRIRAVTGAAYSRVVPTPVRAPRLLIHSPEVAELLGIDEATVHSPAFAEVFGGNAVPEGADPHAACYGGHQFGNWAGQLGDGRAIALGEVIDRNGEHQMLQLKGAGPTPYSRGADGRAVLRSSIREFLCSEAMHHLGIATTRALSLVATGDEVVRDMLYDGNPRPEPGAVVCRVAPSFVRFGTFQLPAARGDVELLRQLVSHTIEHHYPHLQAISSFDERVGAFLAEVGQRSAELVVHWMRVGFVHGVLNTDNLSILGLTIDYGPYGWLENFDPGWTPNTTDASGRRYRYGAQPQIVHWNLWQLANALVAAVEDPQYLQAALDGYGAAYERRYHDMMAARLGWGAFGEGDEALLGELFGVLAQAEIDQVLFFRDLARVPVAGAEAATDDELLAPLADVWYSTADAAGEPARALARWLRSWAARAARGGLDEATRRRTMDALNPRFVLRNYLAQEAIDAAEAGDLTLLHELAEVLRRPYDEQPGHERFAARRPEWARHRVGCSMLSCSS